MQIINVIEIKNGTLDKISSWLIPDPAQQKEKVALAEKHFVKCVKDHRSEYDGLWEGIRDEAILDSDNFNNNAGYEVQIVWSHNVE